ncbi:MAG: hypothetical protein K0U74_16280 [Alphaproteobacteria bacterium]|nr:hypothetical protein [Alphaproteobacteria bacterium]
METPPDKGTGATASGASNANRIVYGLSAICALLVVADLFVHKHGYFKIEHVLGFYAFFGFLACTVLVLAAKLIRAILMRPEDYYDK